MFSSHFNGSHFVDNSPLENEDIYTPVDPQGLREHLHGYHDAHYVISGFEQGFSLGVQAKPLLRPYTKIIPVKPALKEKLMDEAKKGRILGPYKTSPITDLMISPVCVIPKSDGKKFRMIFNLSHPADWSVNDNIPKDKTSVTYCAVAEVAHWIVHRQGPWFLAKADLSDAYRMVPIKKSDWKFLGMRLGQDIFVDRCLPMGAASSCAIFQRISNALAWMIKTISTTYCMVFNYLDDFLFLAKSHQECQQSLTTFIDLCNKLGVPISTEKTIPPSTSLVFLGIGINALRLELFIPPEKASTVLKELRDFLSKKTQKVKKWQSILGRLCHLSQVVTSGRIYLSSVYGSLQGILSQNSNCYRTIGAEAREGLEIWK